MPPATIRFGFSKSMREVARKNVAFTTFGCRLNQYDTETVRTLLEQEGNWRTVSDRPAAQ